MNPLVGGGCHSHHHRYVGDGRPPGVLSHGGLGALAAVQPTNDAVRRCRSALSAPSPSPHRASEVAGAVAWSSRKSISQVIHSRR